MSCHLSERKAHIAVIFSAACVIVSSVYTIHDHVNGLFRNLDRGHITKVVSGWQNIMYSAGEKKQQNHKVVAPSVVLLAQRQRWTAYTARISFLSV